MIRSSKIRKEIFFLKRLPKIVDEFNTERIEIQDLPRMSQLVQLIQGNFLDPLKSVLEKSYHSKAWLVSQKSLLEMKEFETSTKKMLEGNAEELMRVVLGNNKTVWTEVFYPVFLHKCQDICKAKVGCVISHLQHESFEKLQRL